MERIKKAIGSLLIRLFYFDCRMLVLKSQVNMVILEGLYKWAFPDTYEILFGESEV